MSCPVVRAIGLISGAFAESEGLFCMVGGGCEHSISEASYLASKVAIKAASRELAGLPPRTPYADREFTDVVDKVIGKLRYKQVIKKCALGLQMQIIKFEKAIESWSERGNKLEGLSLPSFILVEPDLKPNTMYAVAVSACNYVNTISINGKSPVKVEPPGRPQIMIEGPKISESEYVESMIRVYKVVESIEEYNSICVNKVVECTKNLVEFINRIKLDH
jgi:hypothetical protein